MLSTSCQVAVLEARLAEKQSELAAAHQLLHEVAARGDAASATSRLAQEAEALRSLLAEQQEALDLAAAAAEVGWRRRKSCSAYCVACEPGACLLWLAKGCAAARARLALLLPRGVPRRVSGVLCGLRAGRLLAVARQRVCLMLARRARLLNQAFVLLVFDSALETLSSSSQTGHTACRCLTLPGFARPAAPPLVCRKLSLPGEAWSNRPSC